MNDVELEGVMAHELGHVKELRHPGVDVCVRAGRRRLDT
jgi:Zn-dependent protease with chaperone function